jgi:hypothetical protein
MTDGTRRAEYRPPRCDWRTRHATLDALLTLWRREQRSIERRQPRWSEIDAGIPTPLRRHLFLVGHNLGLRSAFRVAIEPLAADLLGLPRDFRGTRLGHWGTGARDRHARSDGGAGPRPDHGHLAPWEGGRRGSRRRRTRPPPIVLAVPLEPELEAKPGPGSTDVVTLAFRWPVLMAVAPARREWGWW